MFSKENLHHAYFIEGEKKAALSDLESFLREAFKIEKQGHPDVHFAEYESFGIDEGRAIQEAQLMRPIMGDRKFFILITSSITSEAQNSLLKVFEEPTPGTHFFVISSSQRILLPTLRSRMVVIVHASSREQATGDEAKRFIRMPIKDRMAFVSGLIEAKDKARAEGFLLALVEELSLGGLQKKGREKAGMIKEILSLAKYLKDRSSSVKLILERVSLLNFEEK